jgi:uncharacterized protein YjgD (DUF1641 family)
MDTTLTVRAEDLGAVLTKLEALTGEVRGLTEQLEAQRRQTEGLAELAQDLTPVANQAFKTVVRELAEIDGQFTTEELVFLVKRLLANTRRFTQLVNQLEAGLDLLDETGTLSKPLYVTAVEAMDQLERRGYVAFAREGARIVDRVVTEFSEADVRALGDNIVSILGTVKNMTQPDIMALANNAVNQLHESEPEDASVWSLVREMNDPQVRQGMARLLRVLKTFANQPEIRPN